MLFALHALLLTSLTLAQIGFYERGGQRVAPLVCYAVGLAMLVVTVLCRRVQRECSVRLGGSVLNSDDAATNHLQDS